jgi:hypothetical protein
VKGGADECVVGQRGRGGLGRNCDWSRRGREEYAGGGLVMGN